MADSGNKYSIVIRRHTTNFGEDDYQMEKEKRKDIIKKVNELIIKNSKITVDEENLNEKTDILKDLGYDSVSIFQLIAAIERELNIEFDEESLHVDIVGNYAALMEFIMKKLNI
jgi:acyl carrier protein